MIYDDIKRKRLNNVSSVVTVILLPARCKQNEGHFPSSFYKELLSLMTGYLFECECTATRYQQHYNAIAVTQHK